MQTGTEFGYASESENLLHSRCNTHTHIPRMYASINKNLDKRATISLELQTHFSNKWRKYEECVELSNELKIDDRCKFKILFEIEERGKIK